MGCADCLAFMIKISLLNSPLPTLPPSPSPIHNMGDILPLICSGAFPSLPTTSPHSSTSNLSQQLTDMIANGKPNKPTSDSSILDFSISCVGVLVRAIQLSTPPAPAPPPPTPTPTPTPSSSPLHENVQILRDYVIHTITHLTQQNSASNGGRNTTHSSSDICGALRDAYHTALTQIR